MIGTASIFVLALVTTLVCCAMFHIGSRSVLTSRNVRQRLNGFDKCNWSKSFWKSCPVIALLMGMFHKMDRERGPAFIKFVLQRTFLLVLKTKQSVGADGFIVIAIP